MKLKYISCLLFIITISAAAFSQRPVITWQRTIGGDSVDKLTRMIPTADGGMVLCGYSNSPASGDKLQNALRGTYDFWVLKLSKAGITQWAKTYAGNDRDLLPTITQTSDSGYILGGSSISTISGDKTEDPVNQSFDYWVLKLDKAGNILWDNTIGGIQFDKLTAVLETKNGYFVCGSSNSTDGGDKTFENVGSSLWPDYWVIKLNKSGNILWDSTYGGKNRDELSAAILTSDGGLMLAGTSYSQKAAGTQKSEDFKGNGDFWILKIDANGTYQFDKTIGGGLSEYLIAADTVNSIGYVFAGYSNSPASFDKTEANRGEMDYWIVRTDKFGNVLWNKTYGGKGSDYATSIKFMKSKIYVGGYSNSGATGDKTDKLIGKNDFWTLILDRNGNLQNQYTWGGTGDDYLTDYVPVSDTDFIYAGTSNSPLGNDKKNNTVGNSGLSDYWVFRTGSNTEAKQQLTNAIPIASDASAENIKNNFTLEVAPNPVKDVLHINYNANTAKNISVSVYSNSGKLIKQEVLSQSNGSYSLDMSAQSSGVYYAVMQSGSSSITKKFVKN